MESSDDGNESVAGATEGSLNTAVVLKFSGLTVMPVANGSIPSAYLEKPTFNL